MIDETGRNKGLGRGLASLLSDDGADGLAELEPIKEQKEVPIEFLRPSPYQPRRHFDEEHMQSLVRSIKEKGVLQPILVRRDPNDATRYEIVAGERRWRAAQQAKLHLVPVVAKELSDSDSLQVAIIENVQRQDLSPLEEGAGYKRLIDEFDYSQEQLAQVIGKSRSHVANMIRLLSLPDEVKGMLDDGRLSAGAARALITAEDPVKLAREIVQRGLNVRGVEKLRGAVSGTRRPAKEKDADTRALEDRVSAALGLSIDIAHQKRGGIVKISYRDVEQLDEVCRRLSGVGSTTAPLDEDPLTDDDEAAAAPYLPAVSGGSQS
jgi:ParB family chromosome partitioning protein